MHDMVPDPTPELVAVPGRFEMLAVAVPKVGRAPDPAAWSSELMYSAVVGGALPAVPLSPVLIGAPPPSVPLHVRDQLDAFERDRPELKAWCLALPLCALGVADVRTDYLEVPLWITRGRNSDALGQDVAFREVLHAGLDELFAQEDAAVAAVVITAPRGLTADLRVVPGDQARRRELAAALQLGQLGAVIAVAAGRVVLPT